ncbi:energy transducer TonB [candidate division KSB1 bacterium]|nr:energy transducer TonB [candidate division KSB1 bacterium]
MFPFKLNKQAVVSESPFEDEKSNSKLLFITILISLLFHLLIFLIIAIPWMTIFPTLQIFQANEPEIQPEIEKRMEFELVDTPDDADLTDTPKETEYVSDKNANARDEYAKNDLPQGDAYADGQFNVSEYQKGDDLKTIEVPPPQPASPEISKKQDTEAESQIDARPQTERRSSSMEEDPRKRNFLNLFDQAADRRPVKKNAPLRQQTESSARNIGGFTLNTYAWDWAPYLLEMKNKIDQNLFPPAAFTRLGIISGDSIIRFRVFPDGHVENITVLSTNGHQSLMETSQNAIKGSDPFRPLPSDFPRDKPYLEVTAHFQYLISR